MCQDGGRLSENSEASEGGFYVSLLFYIDFTHMKKTLKSQIVRTKESVASARAKLRKWQDSFANTEDTALKNGMEKRPKHRDTYLKDERDWS